MIKVAILDDYLHSAMDSADWSLPGFEATFQVFDHPFSNQEEAARELAEFEVIVAMRERTRFDAKLLVYCGY